MWGWIWISFFEQRVLRTGEGWEGDIRKTFETTCLISFGNVGGVAAIVIDLESKKRGEKEKSKLRRRELISLYATILQRWETGTWRKHHFPYSVPIICSNAFQVTQSFIQFKYRASSKFGQARESHSLDAVLCSGNMRWSFSFNGYVVVLRRKRARDPSVQHSLCFRMCHDLLKCLFHNDQEMSGRYEK